MISRIDAEERALDVELDEAETIRFALGDGHIANALRQACRDAGCRVAFMWGPRGELVASVEVPR